MVGKGKDYYDILGIKRDATEAEIKSAYKKAALKHHPDRNPGNTEAAAQKFKEVSEAFEALNDKDKRSIYDQFGEEGLKGGGGPPPGSSGFGGAFPGGGGMPSGFPPGATFSFGGMPGGMGGGARGGRGGFTPSDPEHIFSQFFGGGNPFGGMGGGMGGGGGGFGGPSFTTSGGPPGGFGMDMDSDDGFPPQKKEVTEIIKPLPLTLEDLYKGVTKKLRVTKKRRNGAEEANTLEINVKPGWKAGTKIRFPGAGHETNTSTQDMVFVVEEKKHEVFKREGDDLVLEVKVPLVEALGGPPASSSAGPQRTVKMLDGRSVPYTIPYPNSKTGGAPLKPGQIIKVVGEGMPISKKGSLKKKGDLLIKIDIVFPDRITASQVEGVKRVFGSS
ncbi:DnaJ-domain-containing protein [Meredithblackwellia eburnea MCA 4105]